MDISNLTLGLALVVGSILFLIAELFIPSGGILFVLAIAGLAVGIAFTFAHGMTAGVLTLVGVVVALPTLGSLLLRYWQRTAFGRRFFLTVPADESTVAALPLNKELEELRGRYGKTLSALRPAGVADFDGRRVDVITEGMMVDEGAWVRVLEVQAGRVLVRPAEKPPHAGSVQHPDFS